MASGDRSEEEMEEGMEIADGGEGDQNLLIFVD